MASKQSSSDDIVNAHSAINFVFIAGVYARQHLSKRLQFGPLQAIKVLDGTDKAREAAHQITQK